MTLEPATLLAISIEYLQIFAVLLVEQGADINDQGSSSFVYGDW
jgi:hypothetical protein